MNIKQRIGQRIRAARKAKGLTIQALADQTKALKWARIRNWEAGQRMPGPLEAQELAGLLGVSPAYLLGLTDDAASVNGLEHALVPRLEWQAVKAVLAKRKMPDITQCEQIIVDGPTVDVITEKAFALVVEDDSMRPEFGPGDLIIVDPKTPATPGKYVLAIMPEEDKPLLRQYRVIWSSKSGHIFQEKLPFELQGADII